MLAAVNEQRANYGLPQLCYNKKLNAAAQAHSEDQARSQRMTHTGSNGSSIGQRVSAQNFVWNNVGENVAAGQRDVASVMDAWMNSPGHRANILNRDFTFFGMGYSTGGETPYWTQNFGSGASEECDNGSTPDSTEMPSEPSADMPSEPSADTPFESPEATMEEAAQPVLDSIALVTPCPSAAPTPAPTPVVSQLKPRSLCPSD
ncbi:hypothetical protein PINS_up022113 [Pythium insidiosum]|nr:hypothetical protein PINS_up022113 [Pythium insidiosum]